MASGHSFDRAGAMAVMARAPRAQLAALWQQAAGEVLPRLLLAPETGLVRLTTRAGLSGPRFQCGEASVTRCVVEWQDLRGYAVHLGSDQTKARLAACLDLLVQQQNPQVLAALSRMNGQQAEAAATRAKTAEATKVRFYTTKTSA